MKVDEKAYLYMRVWVERYLQWLCEHGQSGGRVFKGARGHIQGVRRGEGGREGGWEVGGLPYTWQIDMM